jgi:hypothetical protein
MINSNNDRADYGEKGIIAASPDWTSNEVAIGVKDAIADICHAIQRMGLDPRQMLEDGYESYVGDIDPDDSGAFGAWKPVEWDKERFSDPYRELPPTTIEV